MGIMLEEIINVVDIHIWTRHGDPRYSYMYVAQTQRCIRNIYERIFPVSQHGTAMLSSVRYGQNEFDWWQNLFITVLSIDI